MKYILIILVVVLVGVGTFFLVKDPKESIDATLVQATTDIAKFQLTTQEKIEAFTPTKALGLKTAEENKRKELGDHGGGLSEDLIDYSANARPDVETLKNWKQKLYKELSFTADQKKKYNDIQFEFFKNENALLEGSYLDPDHQKRFEAFIDTVKKEIDPALDYSKDLRPLYKIMLKQIDLDKENYLESSLGNVKDLLGAEGFAKYQKLKQEFNVGQSNPIKI